MFSKAFYIFMHPTGPEIVVAIIGGLSMGFVIGYILDFNSISSLKEFIDFIKRNLHNDK